MKGVRKRAKAAKGQANPPSDSSQRLLAVCEPASVAALFIYLLWQSWLRWPDPLIDFPRELYTAWRMSEGDALYRDIACWYGPLPLLIEAFAFKIFGVGLDTIVWLNLALTGGVLWLVRALLWEIGNRLVVWLGSVMFLVVFAIGQFDIIGNYNFITPYASQATYGFAGLLLLIWALLRHSANGQSRYLWFAGVGLAITYLCKPEPLLAAAGALAVYALTGWVRVSRSDGPPAGWRWLAALAGRVAGGGFALWLLVFLILAVWGGAGYGWSSVNRVPASVLFASLSDKVANSFVLQHNSGFDEPLKNFGDHFIAGSGLVFICALMILAGWLWARPQSRPGLRWMAVAGLALFAILIAWWPTAVLWSQIVHGMNESGSPLSRFAWLDIGRPVVFPTVLAALGAFLTALYAGWSGKLWSAQAARLAVVGAAAALMLARMILNGNIAHYGFFMEPLAMLFLLDLLIVQAPAYFARERGGPLAAAFAGVALWGVIQLGCVARYMFVAKTYPVGQGRDRFYYFQPEKSGNGYTLNLITATVREKAPEARTLVVFPESSAFNYHLRLPNPTPYFAFLAPDLTYSGRERMLADLQAHPPDACVIYARDMREFGVKYFGEDAASGRDILDWVLRDYHAVIQAQFHDKPSTDSYNGHVFDLYVHRAAP